MRIKVNEEHANKALHCVYFVLVFLKVDFYHWVAGVAAVSIACSYAVHAYHLRKRG